MRYLTSALMLGGAFWVGITTTLSFPQGVGPVPKVKFVEVSRQAGIDSFRHVAGGVKKEYIVESKGGGVAVFDYNGDGWMDIFLVSGATFEDLQGPASALPRRNKLFRNNHDGTFTDVTSLAGLTDAGWGMGASAADFDNDGHTVRV